MPTYTEAEAVDPHNDRLAYETIQRRRAYSSPQCQGCFSGARLKFPLVVAKRADWPNTFGHSTRGRWNAQFAVSPGAPATSLHAERQALQMLAQSVGVAMDNSFTMDGESHGRSFGGALYGRGVNVVKLFTELPPCDKCTTWLTGVGSQIVLRHYFCDIFVGYYDKATKPGGQQKMWEVFLKTFVSKEEAIFTKKEDNYFSD